MSSTNSHYILLDVMSPTGNTQGVDVAMAPFTITLSDSLVKFMSPDPMNFSIVGLEVPGSDRGHK